MQANLVSTRPAILSGRSIAAASATSFRLYVGALEFSDHSERMFQIALEQLPMRFWHVWVALDQRFTLVVKLGTNEIILQ